MEESITQEVIEPSVPDEGQTEPIETPSGSEPQIESQPTDSETTPEAPKGDEGQVDEVPAKFLDKDGNVDVKKVLTSYKELEKSHSDKATIAKRAEELQEATGLSLDDVVKQLKEEANASTEEEPDEETEVDKDKFNALVFDALGDDLELMEETRTAKAKDALRAKYPDFNNFDEEMAEIVKQRPDLVIKKVNGRIVTNVDNFELIYKAAKGASLEEKVTEAEEKGKSEAFNKVASKEAAAIEPNTHGTPQAEKVYTREEIKQHTDNMDVDWLEANMSKISAQEKAGLIK
jgi:hypothetical protein